MDNDIKLTKESRAYYDFDINEDTGDFVLENSYTTYTNIALLSDERADASQVQNPYLRRGWIGKIINNADMPDLTYGSKLWLVGGRKAQKQKNNAVDFANKSLEALIIEKQVKDLNVTGEITEQGISVLVNFVRDNDKPSSLNYGLWENS